ncbi:MAG: response regulator [Actinobacteria bacterium]|nr:response regulator [Actinomycetota bacterium]
MKKKQDKIKVLLVDDEEEFVKTLSERLQMRDVDSDTAFDGEQAIESVSEEEPDVLVLDLKMPGIHGLEVLRWVKRFHPAIQVIILTGHGTERDEEKARELGAFDYLKKPVETENLMKKIRIAYKASFEDSMAAVAFAESGEFDTATDMMKESAMNSLKSALSEEKEDNNGGRDAKNDKQSDE